MNTLERIRLRLGISQPEMLRAVGSRLGREAPFLRDDALIDPIFLRRAAELETLYEQWKQEVLANLAYTGPVTAKELGQLLGIYPMKLLRMRYTGLFGSDEEPNYRIAHVTFTTDDMQRLFAINEQYLAQTQGKGFGRTAARRAPLSSIFLDWLEKRHGRYLRQGTAPKAVSVA